MGSIPLPALDIQPAPNPLNEYAKALSVKNLMGQGQLQQQQVQENAQKIQMNQMALDDASGSKRALIDANGDFNKFRQNIRDPKYGISVQGQLSTDNAIMAHQKAAYELDDTALANTQKKSTALAGYLEPLERLDSFDEVQKQMPAVLNKALVDGVITPQQAQEFSANGPIRSMDDLRQHISGLQMVSEQVKQAQDNRKAGIDSWKEDVGSGTMVNVDKTSPDFGKRLPITNGVPIPADLAQQLGNPKLAGTMTTPKMLKEYKDALDAGNHFENFGGSLHLVDSQGKDLKTLGPSSAVAVFNMQQGALGSSALDQAAQRYLETGQLPTGMRSPGMSSAILNRAGEIGGGQNLAANSAAFKANQASYENVTKTLDTLSAFEQTGLKNLKQFTDLAAKIPDTGVPWVNSPVRTLDEKLVGSENMAAVNAARAVALREIARVTNDPKLSGSLTDSARQEVENLVPANATFNQIKAVANVLQNDMANVHTSLAAQKDDIGRRLGMQAHQPNANNTQTPPAGATHQVYNRADKKMHWTDAQNSKDLGEVQ